MSMSPRTFYAPTPDGWVAYQITGSANRDIVLIWGNLLSIDFQIDEPSFVRFLRDLSDIGRVIRFDRRGIGLSDPTPERSPFTLEQWVTDGVAVMDAARSHRAAVIALDIAASQVAVMFAATHPERVSSLVLVRANPCPARRSDWRWGASELEVARVLESVEHSWVTGNLDPGYTATFPDEDEAFQQWLLRARRRTVSPKLARALIESWYESDVRPALPTIGTPTLVIDGDPPSEMASYVARQIPAAQHVPIPGLGRFAFLGDTRPLIDAIAGFIAGKPAAVRDDRVLATVLFTDVVDSTGQVSRMGDDRWRQLLEEHDAIIVREVEQHLGRIIQGTGDGMLATFDGPARAIRCARAIIDAVRPLGIEIRAGLHTGEIHLRGRDIGGVAVHIGQRVSSLAGPSEVLVSRTVADLVAGSGLRFEDRGEQELKGVPGKWAIYALQP